MNEAERQFYIIFIVAAPPARGYRVSMRIVTRRLALAAAGLLAVGAPVRALAGGNCAGTSTGRVPLIDLPPALYQGFEGGLYPGATNQRPFVHERDADRVARLRLLDAAGRPDAVNGRIVLMSVGMSNATQEYQAFIPIAAADPQRNRAVILVDGAQGGWSADKLSDPAVNSTYWTTVASRLAAAGVTAAQVQAIWLKEADASPTLSFPDDALKLQGEIEAIIRDIKVRFPNVTQLDLTSRIYAGYASSALNPEPFAYQSGFAVKWMVGDQIGGDPSLSFDPARGPAVSPWLSWGPYLWADGLVPRSDGLTWSCDDFGSDGTHPSDSGRLKVAQALLAFFKSDPVSARWFVDCAPSDASVFAPPPVVLDLAVNTGIAGDALAWDELGTVAGAGTRYDIVGGRLGDLESARDFSGTRCVASGLAGATFTTTAPDPPSGDAVYYIARGRNACGDGSYAEEYGDSGPRTALDAASPCP
jgi:hypothetical protein